MNSTNFDNQSRSSGFKQFKCFYINIILGFHRSEQKCAFKLNSVHLNQFLVLLYDCVPSLKYFLSIDKLLKNFNVSQLGTGKIRLCFVY